MNIAHMGTYLNHFYNKLERRKITKQLEQIIKTQIRNLLS